MSRVDEALRRAAGGEQLTDVRSGLRERLAVAVPPLTLDDYAREEQRHPERPKPTVRSSPPPLAVAEPVRAADPLTAMCETAEARLVTDPTTGIASVEQYRRLAATLHQLQNERGLKVVMVSSALPREGKTLTCTNLALTLSCSFRRSVLLIDGDLRRPSIQEVFRIPNPTGLSDAVRAGTSSLPLVQITPSLTVLPAGRPDANPMAALTSDYMRAILTAAEQRFDWVILDSPPVTLMSDANVMASLVGGVILVIGAGSTPYHLVQRTIEQLGPDRILGTVLNRVDQSLMTYPDYYDQFHRDREEHAVPVAER
jgi:receptor protein-tyrosine kinase